MADIINLWQVEHYRRRRNLNAKLSKAQEQAERKHVCVFRLSTQECRECGQPIPGNYSGVCDWDESAGEPMIYPRPWTPDDDNDPECA